jgi:hypothetical protein
MILDGVNLKWWIITISLTIIVIGVAWVTYEKYPRTIDLTLSSVKYQLGTEGAKSGTEPATVAIQGKLHTSLKGERIFKGVVSIVGEQIPVPQDQRKLEIHFARDGWGAMSYPYFIYDERGAAVKPEIYQSHLIFANKDFSQVTFLIVTPIQKSEGGNRQTVWNAENGFMLSAPATSREEALTLSNKLMRDYLKPYGKSLQ